MKCVSVYVQHWNLDLIAGALSCCWGEFSRLTTSLGSEVGRGRSGDDDDNDDDDIDVDVYTIPLIVGQRDHHHQHHTSSNIAQPLLVDLEENRTIDDEITYPRLVHPHFQQPITTRPPTSNSHPLDPRSKANPPNDGS